MTDTAFEVIEAEWPDETPATKQAVLDFLNSSLDTAEIKGDKEFLQNVRRVARTNADLKGQVEMRMKEGRLFVRRKQLTTTSK